MIQKRFCDRCKKIMDDTQPVMFVEGHGMVERIELVLAVHYDSEPDVGEVKDVCRNCYQSLREWLDS